MKKVYLFLTVALFSSALVNAQYSRSTKNDGKKKSAHASSIARNSTPTHPLTPSSAVIWSDDFSNPANWTISHAAGTTGDWVIGAAGPSGPFAIDPIATTGDFGLFDSDAICSGNQEGDLTTTNSIDLTGHPNVRLTFNEYYERFHDSTYIYVSTNGTSWTRFEANAGLQSNFFPGGTVAYTPPSNGNPWPVSVDISSVAGNQATVWIRFEFYSPDTNGAGVDTAAGCGYALMIDDIAITDIASTDARLMPADAGEYTIIPIIQPEAIQLRGRLINNGSTVITGGQIIFNVYDLNGPVYSDTSVAAPTLNAGDTSAYLSGTGSFVPAAAGAYLIEQLVYVAGDGDATNDTSLVQVIVDDSLYARDASQVGGSVTAAYGFQNGSTGSFGQNFQIWHASSFTSAQAFITGNVIGDHISMEVWSVVGGVPNAVMGTSGSYALQAQDTGGAWITLAFTNPVSVTPGDYCIVLNQLDTNNIGLAFGPDIYTPQKVFYNPNNTNWAPFPPVGTFLLQVDNPSATLVGVPTLADKSKYNLYPNPSTGYFYITGNGDKNVSVEVINSVGQVVKFVKFDTLNINHIDLHNSPAGMYNVRISTPAGQIVKTIVIQ